VLIGFVPRPLTVAASVANVFCSALKEKLYRALIGAGRCLVVARACTPGGTFALATLSLIQLTVSLATAA